MIETKFIQAKDTYLLRQRVLKPFLKPEECANPGDEDESTFHIGAFASNELVAIATFLKEPAPTELRALAPEQFLKSGIELIQNHSYRLRGMASAPEFRGKGYGAAALLRGEEELKKRQIDLLWFNAREVAFPFYLKLGYKIHGDFFELPNIGPHKVMYKYLKDR